MRLPWKKLFCDPRSSWTRLSLLTRGVGDELLRASDDDGRIVLDGEAPAQVVYRLLAVHPLERRRVREALDELAIAGWLTITTAAIHVHVGEAQPQPKAEATSARPVPDSDPTPTRAEHDLCATQTQPEPDPDPTRARPVRENVSNHAETLGGTGNALSEREEEERDKRRSDSLASLESARERRARGLGVDERAIAYAADAFAHLEHLHAESRRAIGRAWFGLSDVRAAWSGGGLRTVAGDVERCRAVLSWAGDPARTGELEPRVAITRAVDGYALTNDPVAIRSKRSFALFASDPGRWLTTSRASSSEPSDFSKTPASNPDLPDWLNHG